MRALPLQAVLLCLVTLMSVGCISTGETIRVRGEIVDTQGKRIQDAVVLASGYKRGGTLVRPGDQVNSEDESRETTVDTPGDGTFVATSRWAGRLTISVQGYKIRRVDDIGTVFLVPNQSFFQSQDQVRLEVVKDE